MFKQDAKIIADAIAEHWGLPGPLTLTDSLTRGVTADVWLVEDSAGSQYVAKFAYDSQTSFEAGLRIAEHVEHRTGMLTGRPIHDRTGRLTVMLPSVPGQEHPLALLSYVAGTAIQLEPEAAAGLLARVHIGLLDTDPTTANDPIGYLTDESIAIAHVDAIRPVLRNVTNDVLDCTDLTWGTCYGDDAEAVLTPSGEIGLVDWNGVLHAPLLWDVAEWAAGYTNRHDQQMFVAACEDLRFINRAEFVYLDRLTRLRDAHALRFRAYRVLHADHYSDTRHQDGLELRRLAARLDISL